MHDSCSIFAVRTSTTKPSKLEILQLVSHLFEPQEEGSDILKNFRWCLGCINLGADVPFHPNPRVMTIIMLRKDALSLHCYSMLNWMPLRIRIPFVQAGQTIPMSVYPCRFLLLLTMQGEPKTHSLKHRTCSCSNSRAIQFHQ